MTPTLSQSIPIVDQASGNPTTAMVTWWGSLVAQVAKGKTTYVNQKVTVAWATPTGTFARTTFVAYAGQTVSASPTQAQVQAIDDHVKLLSQHLAALISDLQGNGALT